jgi:hypothetical protein
MMRRRRPLLRAAAVGGASYMAGKHVAQRRADQEYQDAAQDQRINDLEQQSSYAAPPPAYAAPAPAAGSSMADQLNRLADLHRGGMLSDDEFAAAKAKLIGT